MNLKCPYCRAVQVPAWRAHLAELGFSSRCGKCGSQSGHPKWVRLARLTWLALLIPSAFILYEDFPAPRRFDAALMIGLMAGVAVLWVVGELSGLRKK